MPFHINAGPRSDRLVPWGVHPASSRMSLGHSGRHPFMTNLGMGEPGESAPPAWYSDPFERHQLRFWDGGAWTDRVSNRGLETTDQPGEAPHFRWTYWFTRPIVRITPGRIEWFPKPNNPNHHAPPEDD